jgi:receptor expression-enhancing protein 1/2/3/4
MVSSLLARCIIITIGTLYPGYRSYKSLINADLREVVSCLRYWIVFSIFLACETVTDIVLSWFPFYYWIKILIVLWMISPAGSTLLYKRFVQPVLKEREQEIDELLEQTKQKGYSTLLDLTNKGFRYASNVFLNTAVLGQAYLGEHLKRSLSTSDINTGPTKGFSNPPATLYEEEEEGDPEFSKRLKEDRRYLSKDNKVVTRRTRSHQREKPQDAVDDPLGDMEMANVIARKQKRTGNKTSSTVSSSNENVHSGTTSKRQVMKTTIKKSAVKSTAPVEEETNSSNETDDEDEKIETRT